MRKKIYHSILIVLLFTASCSTFGSGGDKHFLWEVKSETNTIYILGSVHIAKKEMYPLPDIIMQAYEVSEAIAVEIDISEIKDMNIAMKIAQKAVYQGDETLEENVSPELFAKIEKNFREMGLTKEIYNKFKPWYAVITMTMMDAQEQGYEQAQGIDMHFMERAGDDGKEIYELESIEQQLELFDYLDDAMNVYVEYALSEIDSDENRIDSLFHYWSEGNSEKLYDYMLNDLRKMENYEEFMKVFFWSRNETMARAIESFMEENIKCFVIVGAGHLLTDRSIVGILKSRNDYKIRQL